MKHSILAFTLLTIAGIFCAGCTPVQSPVPAAPVDGQLTMAADCVVNYYKANAAVYITQQKHYMVPSAGQLKVIAEEPTGSYEYLLVRDQFTASKQISGELSDLPENFSNLKLATLVFYSLSAGGSLINTDALPSGEPVKLEGQWYIPLAPSWPTGDLSITLLKNEVTSHVELVELSDASSGQKWLAYNYNLRYNSDLKKQLPRTIDIFDIQNGIASKKRMVQFEYKDIQIVAAD